MKKLIFNLLIALMLCVGFTACHSNDFEGVDMNQHKQEVFVKDFNSTFGVKASDYANHQWGMNIVPLIDVTSKTTRTANTNGNEWASNGYNVPTAITENELRDVLKVFNEKGNASYTSLINWDEYFVQQVYKGVATYKNHAGGTVTGSEHMDWLCTRTTKKVEVVCWWPYEERIVTVPEYDDHINNFNNGNCGAWDGIMLMVNTDSHTFGFKSSEDNGHVFYNFRMEEINGNYYVGFDFEANGQNNNEKVDRDLIYNDWIVKIVPGKGVTPPRPDVDRVRIMAEDLGTETSDFDYNDVVFDIKFIKDGDVLTADILLQAAGGTLPLTIGNEEVHNLFAKANNDQNISTTTMINTNATFGDHIDGLEPVHFTVTLPNSNYDNAWDAINALPICVLNAGNVIYLTVNPGSPAEMFAVPTTTGWSNERVSIRYQYPTFVDWIRDSSVTWWEE